MSAARVNAASRLVMLAERIAKLHAQSGRDILVARSRRALNEASVEFEHILRDLAAGAQAPDLRENYKLLRLLWDEFRLAAQQPATPESVRKLAERTEEVAWIAQKGARQWHEQSKSRASDLVMTAGNARAAAQRLGKLHLQRDFGLSANASSREAKAAEAEILLAIAQVKGAPETGDDLAASARMAEDQLAFLRQAVARLEGGRERATQLEHVAKSSDHIAETLDRIARHYEAL
jgi:hypothetical protein